MQKIRRIPLALIVYIGIILKYIRGFCINIEPSMVPEDFFSHRQLQTRRILSENIESPAFCGQFCGRKIRRIIYGADISGKECGKEKLFGCIYDGLYPFGGSVLSCLHTGLRLGEL